MERMVSASAGEDGLSHTEVSESSQRRVLWAAASRVLRKEGLKGEQKAGWPPGKPRDMAAGKAAVRWWWWWEEEVGSGAKRGMGQ
jgi:hypothetical protein